MEKGRKIIIIVVAVLLVLVVAVVLYFNLTKIEIPEGYDLKVTYRAVTSKTSYYFYENCIIEEKYENSIAAGTTVRPTKIKYNFNENIDISELKTYISSLEKSDDMIQIEITEKSGIVYNILERTNSLAEKSLIERIWEITEKADSKKVR